MFGFIKKFNSHLIASTSAQDFVSKSIIATPRVSIPRFSFFVKYLSNLVMKGLCHTIIATSFLFSIFVNRFK